MGHTLYLARIDHMKTIVLVFAFLVSVASASGAAKTTPLMKVSGIYSDLAWNDLGGDLLGMELMIVPRESKGDLAWSAFVQLAEGGAPYTAIVPLTISGDTIEFTLPPGEVYGGLHFTGKISSTDILLNGPSGQVEVLRRGKSYWQGN